jgi:hypothetical protein
MVGVADERERREASAGWVRKIDFILVAVEDFSRESYDLIKPNYYRVLFCHMGNR